MQVLTFLRADRNIVNKDGTKSPSLAIYPAQLQKHLKSLKLLVPKNLVRCITNLYPGMSRTGQQHLFLKPGVEMDHVPSRQVGLSKGLVEYPRSLMIARTTISDVTLAVIDNGKLVF